LEDSDIPHRTKMTEISMEHFKIAYAKMCDEIQNRALGRIATTTDIWSRVNLDSHMAISAHYTMINASGRLIVKS
ncbi:hypothetical protein C8J56DRAFT_775150, partial [Mycena floridula]